MPVYNPGLGRFFQTDTVGTRDDLNLYAYVYNDPTDKTDPSGQAHVCTDSPGSRIPSCVDVDGNGDGNSKDNDLTKSQVEKLGRAFHSFIVAHNGQDIGANGISVSNFGANQDTENMFRAVSQFVGTARGGWGDAHWSLNVGTVQGFKDAGFRTFQGGPASAWSGGPPGSWNMFFDSDTPAFVEPSNVSRAIIHETLHRTESSGIGHLMWYMIGGHEWLDHNARQLNMGYGFGKCEAIGNFPACGGWW